MSTLDRPTREQVDLALADADLGSTIVGATLAAEVRALRTELADVRRAADEHPDVPHGELLAELRRLVENDEHCIETHGVALVARTPQPAEQAVIAAARAWRDKRRGLRYPPPSTGYDATSSIPEAAALYAAVDALDAAPLPAVPDGDGDRNLALAAELRHIAIVHSVGGATGDDAEEEQFFAGITRVVTALRRRADQLDAAGNADAPDGEDVPARLDAAADACHEHGWSGMASEFSSIAHRLRSGLFASPEIRAAVAAALARPTGDA